MLKGFQDLGDLVDESWRRTDRDPDAFAAIATTALTASRALLEVERSDIASWLMRSRDVPEQMDNDFGQPPVKLYAGEGFRIDALFWVDSTTSVHEHSFSGAFGVLCGGSVHSTYQFEPERRVTRRFVAGRVRFQQSELLSRGSVRTIVRGSSLIHSLFHLDRPSVSIVVRTSQKVDDAPQYAYQKPYLALDPFNIPTLQATQLRLLRSMGLCDPKEFWRLAAEIVSRSTDPWMLYQVLSIAYQKSDEKESWFRLLTRVNRSHGDLLKFIVPCLREESRKRRIELLRSTVHEPTHRFFLALLLNVPTRDRLFALAADAYPGHDPETLVLRWLCEIFSEGRMGIRLTPSSMYLLKLMMRNPNFDDARAALNASFGARDEDEQRLRDAWMRIQSVDMFGPLLSSDLEVAGAAMAGL